MKLPPFAYFRPHTIAEACALLREHRNARLLAGGQSLLVQMMQGTIAPDTLVDINAIADFPVLTAADGMLHIGALTRHAELAGCAMPLLRRAAAHIAHPAIRNRGTVCGSLALADPAGELPACAMLLDAEFSLASADGIRLVPARDFYTGMFETCCARDEILVEARFPVARPREGFGFAELGARRNDPAQIGAALRADTTLGTAQLVLFGAGAPVVFCTGLDLDETALGEQAVKAMQTAAPASSSARLRQARALAQRALCEALAPETADA